MISIYYTKVRDLFTCYELNRIREFYNIDIINRVLESNSDIFKKRRTTFMCMMFKICEVLRIPFSKLRTIYHNNFGKLMMSNSNIVVSYSGDYVFCILSNYKIGLDVERIDQQISDKEVEMFNKLFKKTTKSVLSFLKEWTRLESLAKYYDNKGIMYFMSPGIKNNEYDLKTTHMLFNNNYIIALSYLKSLHSNKKIQLIQI